MHKIIQKNKIVKLNYLQKKGGLFTDLHAAFDLLAPTLFLKVH